MPQAQSVALPKRLPLVLEPENRGQDVKFDARLVNGYIETKKGEEGGVWIYERVGLLNSSRPPAVDAVGRGIFNWLGDIYSIFGDTLYKNGVAVAGTVDDTNGVYRFDSCLGATPKLQMGNGVKAYNYDDGAGLVQITDAQFPTSFVKGWAYLDGTTYVMTPSAHILGSDINDPTAWDALNDILAQIEPDQGMATDKQLVYVIAFKQWTTEIFYDAGNGTGSPLGRVEGAKVNWGCLSADSVQEIDGALFWLAQSKDGSPEVVVLDNLKAQAVSTKALERLLESADLTTIYSWTIKQDGHRFYVLTIKESNYTFAYDLDEQMWSQWTDTDGNYMPIVSSCTGSNLAAHQHFLQHESNGRIYLASSDYATDDGDLIQVDLITPNFDGGVRVAKLEQRLEIISDQQEGSTLGVRTNDQDYNPTAWTEWRSFDLSQARPFLDDFGSFYRRVHHFRHRRSVRMPRIRAMELMLDLGTL